MTHRAAPLAFGAIALLCCTTQPDGEPDGGGGGENSDAGASDGSGSADAGEDDSDDGGDEDTGTPASCDSDVALDMYQRRIEPLVSGDQPDSCSQCHLSGAGLSAYVQDNPCETMACLVASGEVDLDNPEDSTILERILLADPASELITPSVIQDEYDGFMAWIQYSAECHDTVCGEIDDPCNAGSGAGDPSGPSPLGLCEESALAASFAQLVYVWRGRCDSCHQEGAPRQCDPEFAGLCAPAFIESSDDPTKEAANTMYNLIGLGAVDREDPIRSAMLLKPLAEETCVSSDVCGIAHLGGAKIGQPDEPTFQEWLTWLEDYSACYLEGIQPDVVPGVTARVTNPTDGSSVAAGDPVYLFAQARSPVDGELYDEALVWTSDLQGQIATGTRCVACEVLTTPGTHTITVTATDSTGEVAADSIQIVVN